MTEEHDRYLCLTYPKLYAQRYLPMDRTCMCWGFECGDGWFNLLDKLSAAITKACPTCEAVQVKEKYGGLRFYYANGNEQVYKLVAAVEHKSLKTCEVCGKPGKINSAGCWLSIRCPRCRKDD